MAIKVSVDEFDHVVVEFPQFSVVMELGTADKLAEAIRSQTLRVRAGRRLQQLLQEKKK